MQPSRHSATATVAAAGVGDSTEHASGASDHHQHQQQHLHQDHIVAASPSSSSSSSRVALRHAARNPIVPPIQHHYSQPISQRARATTTTAPSSSSTTSSLTSRSAYGAQQPRTEAWTPAMALADSTKSQWNPTTASTIDRSNGWNSNTNTNALFGGTRTRATSSPSTQLLTSNDSLPTAAVSSSSAVTSPYAAPTTISSFITRTLGKSKRHSLGSGGVEQKESSAGTSPSHRLSGASTARPSRHAASTAASSSSPSPPPTTVGGPLSSARSLIAKRIESAREQLKEERKKRDPVPHHAHSVSSPPIASTRTETWMNELLRRDARVAAAAAGATSQPDGLSERINNRLTSAQERSILLKKEQRKSISKPSQLATFSTSSSIPPSTSTASFQARPVLSVSETIRIDIEPVVNMKRVSLGRSSQQIVLQEESMMSESSMTMMFNESPPATQNAKQNVVEISLPRPSTSVVASVVASPTTDVRTIVMPTPVIVHTQQQHTPETILTTLTHGRVGSINVTTPSPRPTSASFATAQASGTATPPGRPSDSIPASFLASLAGASKSSTRRSTIVLDIPLAHAQQLDHAFVHEHGPEKTPLHKSMTLLSSPMTASHFRTMTPTNLYALESPSAGFETRGSSLSTDSRGIPERGYRQSGTISATVAIEQSIEEPDSPSSDFDVEYVHNPNDRASSIPLILAFLRERDLLVMKARSQIKQIHAQLVLRAAGIDITKEGSSTALKYLDYLTQLKRNTTSANKYQSVEEVIADVEAEHKSYKEQVQSLLALLRSPACLFLSSALKEALTQHDAASLLSLENIPYIYNKYLVRILSYLNRLIITNQCTPFQTLGELCDKLSELILNYTRKTLVQSVELLRIYLTSSPCVSTLFYEDITPEVTALSSSASSGGGSSSSSNSKQADEFSIASDPLAHMIHLANGLPNLFQIFQQLQSQQRKFETLFDLVGEIERVVKFTQSLDVVKADSGNSSPRDSLAIQGILSYLTSNSNVFGLDTPIAELTSFATKLLHSSSSLGPDFADSPILLLKYLTSQHQQQEQKDLSTFYMQVETLRTRVIQGDELWKKIVLFSYLTMNSSSSSSSSTLTAEILDAIMSACSSYGARATNYAFWFLCRIDGERTVDDVSTLSAADLPAAVQKMCSEENAAYQSLCEYINTHTASKSLSLQSTKDLCYFPSVGPMPASLLFAHVRRLLLHGYAVNRSALAAASDEWQESRSAQKAILASLLASSVCRVLPHNVLCSDADLERMLRINAPYHTSSVIPSPLIALAHILTLSTSRRAFLTPAELTSALFAVHNDRDTLMASLIADLQRFITSSLSTSSSTSDELRAFLTSYATEAGSDVSSTIVYMRYLTLTMNPDTDKYDTLQAFLTHQLESLSQLLQSHQRPVKTNSSSTSNSLPSAIHKQLHPYYIKCMMLRYYLGTSHTHPRPLFYSATSYKNLSDSAIESLMSNTNQVFSLLFILQRSSECYEEFQELVRSIPLVNENLASEKKQCLTLLATLYPLGARKNHCERLFQLGQAQDTYETLQALLQDGGNQKFAGVDQLIKQVRIRSMQKMEQSDPHAERARSPFDKSDSEDDE